MSDKGNGKEKELPVDDQNAEDLFESLDDIVSTDDVEYKTIKSWGGRTARIGSLTAAQMITFLENNDIPAKKRENGLMLITLSLVNREGKRLVDPDDKEAIKASIVKLRNRNAKTNGNIVETILLLNGLNRTNAQEIAKNVLSEVSTDASHTVSH